MYKTTKFIKTFFTVNCRLHVKNDTASLSKEKIIGGSKVDIKSYPFQASILLLGIHISCGGSIITPRHILTSAHCFRTYKSPKLWRVRSGSSYRNSGGLVSQVSRIITHEKYFYTNTDQEFDANDIAILVLQKPLDYDDYTQEIPLISRDIRKGEEAHASGWGYTKPDSESFSDRLKALRLRVDDDALCQFWDLSEKKICARSGSEDGTCFGDSGGPLTVEGQLAGTVTGTPSTGCGIFNDTLIFTSVFHHKVWIEKNLKN